jgi:hypothetical protein
MSYELTKRPRPFLRVLGEKAGALSFDRALFVSCFFTYHRSVPWHEFEHVRVAGFQPGVLPLAMFTTPLACVAEFTVVEL